MKLFSYLGASFLILVIFSLAFGGVFVFNNIKNSSQKAENTINQNVTPPKTNIEEKDEVIEEKAFNPKNSTWRLIAGSAEFSKRDAHNVTVFLDKLWLLGGVGGAAPDYSKNNSDIWNSEDGQKWTLVTDKAPWGPRRAGEVFVFKNKMWLLGGVDAKERYLNDVWYSENGVDWTLAKKNADWLPRKGFGSAVYQEKMWVIGGAATTGVVNDVWYSENGVNWTLATKNAGWKARYDLTTTTFAGKIWMSGGIFPGEMGEKEVWYTEDGINWLKPEGEVSWPGRHGHCFLSYKDYLWIIGGWSGYAHGYNDVWYSKDGAVWKQLYEDGNFLWKGREDLECVDFNGKIFMTGGMETGGQRTNDVWALSQQ